MSYGLNIELIGRSQIFKRNWKVKVYKKDYSGAVIYRNVPAQSPFLPKKDSASTIRGTSFQFSIRAIVDFEFIDLFTVDTKEYLVEFLDHNDIIFWSGFILPEQYQETYKPAPNYVTFTASDQLGLLKESEFNSISQRKSFLEILNQCLQNTGLPFGYTIAIGISETRQNEQRSVLSEVYVDASIYNGMKCYDVIETIMNTFDATITQDQGRWMIIDGFKVVPRFYYDSNIQFESVGSAIETAVLGQYGKQLTEIYPTGSALELTMQTSFKTLKITDDYGLKSDMLPASTADAWVDSSTLPGWDAYNSATLSRNILGDKAFIQVEGDVIYNAANLHQNGVIAMLGNVEATTELMKLSVDFAQVIHQFMVYDFMIRFRFYVTTAADGDPAHGTSQYLSVSGWSATPAFFTLEKINKSNKLEPSFQTFSTFFDGIPLSGTVGLIAYLPETTSQAGTLWSNMCMFLKNISLMQYNNGAAQLPGQIRAITLNKSTSAATKELKLYASDVPVVPNSKLLYKNFTSFSDGSLTGQWVTPDLTTADSLLNILTEIYASNNRKAKQIMKGRIRGQGLAFDKQIQVNYPYERKFEIIEFYFDVISDAADVTLQEILPFVAAEFSISDQPLSGSTGSSSSSSGGASVGGSASNITVDTADFGGILSADESDVQKALDKIDDHVHSGYLTQLTKAMIEAVLTGTISSHEHAISLTKAMIEAVLTGTISSHGHNYEPANANIQAHISSINNPHQVTKSQVGLGNVDNTSDLNKPISNATQTALDGKLDKNGGAFGGALALKNPSGIVKWYISVDSSDNLVFSSVAGFGMVVTQTGNMSASKEITAYS